MGESELESYRRRYTSGDLIFEEGEVGDTVFLIDSGEVDVLKGSGADQRKLATLGDGELVGEMALEKGDHERTATVKATTDVTGWRFPGPAFETLIEKKQSFRQKLVKSLIDRLMSTTDRLASRESSELKKVNRLLLGNSRALLSDRSPEDLEESRPLKRHITVSKDFLAYHYDVPVDHVEAFLEQNDQESLEGLGDSLRMKLSELSRRIAEDLVETTAVDYPGDATDSELVDAARRARKLLRKLKDHSQTYDNDKLQTMMEARKDYLEILEERREEGRDDYLIKRFAKLLKRMKEEINLRYE